MLLFATKYYWCNSVPNLRESSFLAYQQSSKSFRRLSGWRFRFYLDNQGGDLLLGFDFYPFVCVRF